MIMKRFLVTNLMAMAFFINGWSCAGEYSTHNYYMMDVAPRNVNLLNLEERFNQYWKNYTGNEYTEYRWSQDKIMEAARQKNDTDMMAYLTHLNNYLDISHQLGETWDYPTKEQLAERRATLQNMRKAAESYKGARLRAQYALLAMRANMLLNDHEANISYWKAKGGSLPESAYKDMMRNIYAGALYHTGQKKEAFDIYAEQGDQTSIRWAMRKYRNLAGIQTIFEENPNAPTLYYLVQDFVNNVQESIDTDDAELIKMVGRLQLSMGEAGRFVEFADKAAANGAVKDRCLWKTASALTSWLLGRKEQAAKAADEAMKLDGAERTKDNARCVRLLVMAGNDKVKGKTLRQEMEWLDAKAATEKEEDYCFSNARDRILRRALFNKYNLAGNLNMALAVTGVEWEPRTTEFAADSWNRNYSGEFYYALDTLNTAQLQDYYRFISGRHKDAFEAYVVEHSFVDADYFNDLIGTRLMAENKFEEAIPWLEKVPVSFLNSQNISYYATHRDWTVSRWLQEQDMGEGEFDGPQSGKLSENMKLKFCREVLQLRSQFQLASEAQRPQLAYQLGVRYDQASNCGDCWYLTDYGWTSMPDLKPWQADFEKIACQWLDESKLTTDFKLRTQSLFGLSFIAYDGPWLERNMNWATGKETLIPHPETHQYQALAELSEFARQNASKMPEYVTKCDLIRQFRNNK